MAEKVCGNVKRWDYRRSARTLGRQIPRLLKEMEAAPGNPSKIAVAKSRKASYSGLREGRYFQTEFRAFPIKRSSMAILLTLFAMAIHMHLCSGRVYPAKRDK